MQSVDELMSGRWLCLLGVLARAGGFAALAPTLGLAADAIKHRVALAILLTLILLPSAPSSRDGSPDQFPVEVVLTELAAGLLLGFTLRVLLAGISQAAQLMEQQLGIPSWGDVDDEAGATALSQLYQLTALVLLLAQGGHRHIVAALLDAPTAWNSPASDVVGAVDAVVRLLTLACWLALRVAAPVVLALLVTSLSVGMIARVLPQFSGPALAMPAQIALGLGLVLLSITAVGVAFNTELTQVLRTLCSPP